MDNTDELDERSRQIIWRSVGTRSAVQIAKELGVTPEVVLRERQRMREEIDVLTIEERQFKLLIELENTINLAREKLDNVAEERNMSGLINSVVNGIKTMSAELRKLEAKNSAAVESLNKKRVEELLRLVDVVVLATFEEVSDRYGIDGDELIEIFQSKLIPAAKELES